MSCRRTRIESEISEIEDCYGFRLLDVPYPLDFIFSMIAFICEIVLQMMPLLSAKIECPADVLNFV